MMHRGRAYAEAIYNLCERVKAKTVIEVGLGIMASGMAIIESLRNRPPSFLTTIDTVEPTYEIPKDQLLYAAAAGVSWRLVKANALHVALAGKFDLLHLDGVGIDTQANISAYENLGGLVRSGGIYAAAGAEEYPTMADAYTLLGGFEKVPFHEGGLHFVKVMP